MTQLNMFDKPIFGTEPRKLVRNPAPDTSIEAATKLDSSALEEMVFCTIKSFGSVGCISDDVRRIHSDYPYSSITARYSALIAKGLIRDAGERRKGDSGRSQRVLVSIR